MFRIKTSRPRCVSQLSPEFLNADHVKFLSISTMLRCLEQFVMLSSIDNRQHCFKKGGSFQFVTQRSAAPAVVHTHTRSGGPKRPTDTDNPCLSLTPLSLPPPSSFFALSLALPFYLTASRPVHFLCAPIRFLSVALFQRTNPHAAVRG